MNFVCLKAYGGGEIFFREDDVLRIEDAPNAGSTPASTMHFVDGTNVMLQETAFNAVRIISETK